MIASGGFGVHRGGELASHGARLPRASPVCPLSEGVALGHVVLHEPRIVVTRLIAEDVELERRRLSQAIEELTGMIDEMLERGDLARAGEHREVLEAYPHVRPRSGLAAAARRGDAHWASPPRLPCERVRNDTRARMLRQIDPHARERLHDIDDLSNRLLRLLSGGAVTAAAGNLPQDTILIARTMGPAELLDYDRQRLRGLVLEEGSADEPRRDRGARARHRRDRPGQGRARCGRGGRRRHRRCGRQRAAYPTDARGGLGLCRQGEVQGAAPGAISPRSGPSPRSRSTGSASASISMPASCSTCRISTSLAPTASGCSAPSCNS